MAVVSAFLIPGTLSPALASGCELAADALARSAPDVLLVFANGWQSNGDLLWSMPDGTDTSADPQIDAELAEACIAGTRAIGVESAPDANFIQRLDPASLDILRQLNRQGLPVVIAASNDGHDFNRTERLGGLAAAVAQRLRRRVAVVGIGGLSTGAAQTLSDDEDRWNRQILDLIEKGDIYELRCALPQFNEQARADGAFKHFAWILGALSGVFTGAGLHAYGASGAGGAAVIEFVL
jgi:2-aminophenol/2-amino-5-chlorophenol 1,6-dioxygenase alpha subunit